jgi:SH3-like domain-containing protein
MESRHGFTKMTLAEFGTWLAQQRVGRTILHIQQHHTWNPSYAHFDGRNHFERQQAMRNHHVGANGWADIGQHFTTFPDGTIMTGRPLERAPACIYGQNANAICLEHFGNFDRGGDNMTPQHRETIIKMTALLCRRFNLPVNVYSIVYHHWFDLSSGVRNNGGRNTKSCPGTNFFGGNSVYDATQHFLPLVQQALGGQQPTAVSSNLKGYAVVTASRLNIRDAATTTATVVADREPLLTGSILRVYEEKNGWSRISQSQSHWVATRFTHPVKYAVVKADVLRVRSGPQNTYPMVGTVAKGEELFVIEERDGWSKISIEDKWVNSGFLNFR